MKKHNLDKKRDIKFDDVITPEIQAAIKEIYDENPYLKNNKRFNKSIIEIDNSWIQTFSGKKFFPLNPKAADVCIEDIAHALSMLCRFTGHCSKFYSVAQHSILVSYLCDDKDSLHGLLHDASEAYICDLSSPIKRSGQFENYKIIEKKLQEIIFEKFKLDLVEPPSVKKADTIMLYTEARDLMSPQHPEWINIDEPAPFTIIPLNPQEAEMLFLKRYYSLI